MRHAINLAISLSIGFTIYFLSIALVFGTFGLPEDVPWYLTVLATVYGMGCGWAGNYIAKQRLHRKKVEQ